MEALSHFIFVLTKIVILASIYAGLLLFLFRNIYISNPENWFQRITANRKPFLCISGAIISILLFIWMFTYWGNHGFGDSARIPIGYGIAIENINWSDHGYISNVEVLAGRRLEMTKFKVNGGTLVGNLDSWFDSYQNQYFSLDLESRKLTEFKYESDFNHFAGLNSLPKANELESFEENYRNYWSGWRLVFLP